jgi:3-oxoacyl-[acyl-carrier protein] reductase
VQADVATAEGQAALLGACPEPDILVNNNAGPPFRDFRELTRAQMIDGVIANMVVAIELTQKVIDPMVRRQFGRIVNITSGSVKMPLAGLDLSSGARAGLTAFFAGVARAVAASNVTINFLLPGTFDTERLHSNIVANAKSKGISIEQAKAARVATVPAKRFGSPEEFGAAWPSCVPPRPGTSPGRTCSSTAAHFPARCERQKRTRPACAGPVAPRLSD